ncbi:MAG: radical SAM protein [Candidatus ainarchaeum sp.]|nr:radical SAM protein [Candidatus ainarchaeum sp.]
MFVLVESQKWNKIDNRPDLGVALLKAILNENDFDNKLVLGQTRFTKDFFLKEFNEICDLVNSLPKAVSFKWAKYLKSKLNNEYGFKIELKEDYSLFTTTNEDNFFSLSSQMRLNKNLESIFELYNYWFDKKDTSITQNLFNNIKNLKPDAVGFSLSFPEKITEKVRTQIKQELDIPIILGGSLTFHVSDQDLDRFFSNNTFDYLIKQSGDDALPKLLSYIEGKEKLENIPNLIYKKRSGNIKKNSVSWLKNLDLLPTPDFSDFELDNYFSLVRMLPMQTSRGCSWAKCAFCTDWLVQGPVYVEMNKEKVVANIEQMKKKYKTNYFLFHDEELPADRANELSKLFIDRNLESYFLSLARFDPAFNSRLLNQMYSAGFRILTWGLESGCQRVLNLINKDTKIKNNSKILKESHNAGILNICFFMLGFPTETKEEAIKTINFLEKNSQFIDCALWDIFKLEEKSQVRQNPNKFNITISNRKLSHGVLPYFEFETSKGMSRKEAKKLKEEITKKIISGKLKVYNQRFKYWNYNQIETQLLYLASKNKVDTFSNQPNPNFFQQSNHEEEIK